MRMRWRVILPVVGLLLFAGETYQSVRMNREGHFKSDRYFWWSSVRLDPNPRDKDSQVVATCKEGQENCVTWDLRSRIVDPGWLTELLMLSGLPAFLVGAVILSGMKHLGINQIWGFMISMPLLLSAWYYLLGWLVDRWKNKRQQPS
jgi:hypothetical protein